MRGFGGFITRGALAMAGRRSPWGNNGDTEGESSPAAPDDSPPAASGPAVSGGEDAPGETPAPPAPPAKGPGPRNPWQTSGSSEGPPRRSASIEDIFRPRPGGPRGGGPGGGGGNGGGGGFPKLPMRANGKSWLPFVGLGLIGIWLFSSSAHQLGSTQQGIVTTFGKYSHTIGNGVSLTLPWPIQDVTVVDVTSIKRDTIPEGEAEKLMLTADQNLVDLSYIVRWSIKDLKLYSFQLSNPDATVKEVAEAAMRASVAEVPLKDVLGGAGRAVIEQAMRQRMQAVLDSYRSGVLIQGVDIKKADPPEKVVASFQEVTVAQQEAQRDLSNAQAWAQQVTARAQGDAAAFDKVYAQYKLAPDVTRRRMYYETMERVLSANDKVIVEANGVTPYLPLPEVRRKAQADAQAQPAASQGAQ